MKTKRSAAFLAALAAVLGVFAASASANDDGYAVDQTQVTMAQMEAQIQELKKEVQAMKERRQAASAEQAKESDAASRLSPDRIKQNILGIKKRVVNGASSPQWKELAQLPESIDPDRALQKAKAAMPQELNGCLISHEAAFFAAHAAYTDQGRLAGYELEYTSGCIADNLDGLFYYSPTGTIVGMTVAERQSQ